MNLILLQGVIQNTWTLRNALYARLVHYDENGQPGYYTCVFEGNILVRETSNGDATQRVVALNRRNKDRLAKGAVVAVVGRLGHRDERVGLADFLRRCEGSSLTEAEQATLHELAARTGEENRALNEIQVRELAYM